MILFQLQSLDFTNVLVSSVVPESLAFAYGSHAAIVVNGIECPS